MDDGPTTMEQSIAMAEEAVAEGIQTIVATPHHLTINYRNEKPAIARAVHELNEVLKQRDLPLLVVPGQEIHINGEIAEQYELGLIQTINETQKYILLEFPSNHVPRYTPALLYDLLLKGLIPIIVHPERNSEIAEHPNILYDLVLKGALVQVTASSMTGGFGKTIKKLSLQLIEHNLVHFVASDAHNSTNRPFNLRECYDTIEHELGMDIAVLFKKNAYAVIAGHVVSKFEPEEIRNKKIFGIF